MATRSTMVPGAPVVKKAAARNFPATDPRTRDAILEAAGRARRAIPLKAGAVARALGHSEVQESGIRSGARMSPTGRAALEAYREAAEAEANPLERAGGAAAYIEFTIRAIAMWPELETMTTAELEAELTRTLREKETRANSECNDLDADCIAGMPYDRSAMLEAHTRQGTASIRVAAILQLLERRAK